MWIISTKSLVAIWKTKPKKLGQMNKTTTLLESFCWISSVASIAMLWSKGNSFGKYIPLKSIKSHMSLQSLVFLLISLQIITGAIVISIGFNGKPWAHRLGIKIEMDFSSAMCYWHWPHNTNNLQFSDCCCLVWNAFRINFSPGCSLESLT